MTDKVVFGKVEVTQVWSPRSAHAAFACRAETTDLATVGATFNLWGKLNDEYGFRDEHVTGTFVDVGGHIGTATVAVLLDNPEARAIVVEPLPENVEMIRMNLALNDVAGRARVIEAAVGDGTPVEVRYGSDVNRYIGDIRGSTGEGVQVATVTLKDLLADGPIELLKIDCEGGEWALFGGATKAQLRKVARIVGEYHTFGPDRLHALLDATHRVEVAPQSDGIGMFTAVAR